MAYIVACSKCGLVLARVEKPTTSGYPRPDIVAYWYSDRCPRCNAPLKRVTAIIIREVRRSEAGTR